MLLYNIKTENVNKDFTNNKGNFDFSNYSAYQNNMIIETN